MPALCALFLIQQVSVYSVQKLFVAAVEVSEVPLMMFLMTLLLMLLTELEVVVKVEVEALVVEVCTLNVLLVMEEEEYKLNQLHLLFYHLF